MAIKRDSALEIEKSCNLNITAMQLKVAAKFLAATILAGGMVVANARSLSYRMRASEGKACFYAVIEPNVNLASALLQFYFAVGGMKKRWF